MKTLSIVTVFLVLAVFLTLFAVEDPGYVLLARSPWRIEMSLTVFVALVLLSYFFLHWLFRFLRALWHTPRGVSAWRQYKSLQRAQRAMVQGYIGVLTGDYYKAEQKLLGNMQNHPTPLMNFLAAAYAAHQREDSQQRDQYLDKAQKLDPNNSFALGLAQARLQFDAGEFEQASAKCNELRKQQPRHPQLLMLTARLHQKFGNWSDLLMMIPQLRKNKLFSEQIRDQTELLAATGVLQQVASENPEMLHKTWQRLSGAQKHRSDIIAAYAQLLMKTQRHDDAEHLLRVAIKRQWSDTLVYLYGLCAGSKPSEQFVLAESWVAGQTEDNPTLLLTLGRLAIRNQLWGKARSYLEVCIDGSPHEEAYLVYGQLLEQLGEKEHALEIYRRGAGVNSKRSPENMEDPSDLDADIPAPESSLPAISESMDSADREQQSATTTGTSTTSVTTSL